MFLILMIKVIRAACGVSLSILIFFFTSFPSFLMFLIMTISQSKTFDVYSVAHVTVVCLYSLYLLRDILFSCFLSSLHNTNDLKACNRNILHRSCFCIVDVKEQWTSFLLRIQGALVSNFNTETE